MPSMVCERGVLIEGTVGGVPVSKSKVAVNGGRGVGEGVVIGVGCTVGVGVGCTVGVGVGCTVGVGVGVVMGADGR